MTYLADPAQPLWQQIPTDEFGLIKSLLNRVPVPIGEVAAALSIDVVSLTLPVEISGLIKKMSPDVEEYQIQINNTDAPVRQRFTVAHEIAHYFLHKSHIDSDGITDSILYRSKLSDKKEAEANRLAAAMLLPWNEVQAWHHERYGCAPKAEFLDEIAKAFRVSSLAVGFRFGF